MRGLSEAETRVERGSKGIPVVVYDVDGHRSPTMAAMIEAARSGGFDVLLVGYVARWQRNLRQTLNLLEDALHPAGVAIWFCDEELLSSSERHWDQLVDEAKGADSWLRRHRRRVREEYAAKRATEHDPGGHPPVGFRRNPDTRLLEPDPDRLAVVRRAFELAAERRTDPEHPGPARRGHRTRRSAPRHGRPVRGSPALPGGLRAALRS